MQGDLHLTAGAVDRIASTSESIKPLIENERTIILEETSRQRALVMDALSLERERAIAAIIGAFAEERTELLRNAEAQRLATLEWASAERREAIAALSATSPAPSPPFAVSAPSSSTTCVTSSTWC